MKHSPLIPVLPGPLDGRGVQFVDARQLHAFLGVGRDFSNWIKGRIQEYGFVESQDYLVIHAGGSWGPDSRDQGNQMQVFSPNPAKSLGRPTIDYFLTLDMAKELAMVERTARGREARRYFIDCERQLRQLQQAVAATHPAAPVVLSRAQKQAINRQAWADVAGQAYANFHARREELLRNLSRAEDPGPLFLHRDFRPRWAR